MSLSFGRVLVVASLLLWPHSNARAEGVDKQTQKALEAAQSTLTEPTQRRKAIKGSAEAANADSLVQKIGGSAENTQQIYELAADVVADLVKQTGGDPDKMQAILVEAQKDPAAFAKKFSPARRAKLKKVADRIEAQQPKPLVP